MTQLLAALVAFIVFCSCLLAHTILTHRKKRAAFAQRIGLDGSAQDATPAEQHRLLGLNEPLSANAAIAAGILRGFGVSIEDESRKLDAPLAHAGISSPDAPIWYLFFQRILSFPLVALGVWLLFAHGKSDMSLAFQIGGLLVIVIGAFGPKLWVQNQTDRRKKLLLRAFPDTLDLLMVCVESGLALDASLNRVCNELGRAYPEITEELNRTRIELAMLNDRIRALTNFGERVNIVAFRSLVAALIQSERFGTNLTDTMRVLSEDYRLSRLMDAENKAARLPVLLTIPLIFFLLPAFFLIILGPAIISFMRNGEMITGP